MENYIQAIVYTHLTKNDFNRLNNVEIPSTHKKVGGSQSYIDISDKSINISQLKEFFGEPSDFKTNGPSWMVQINSIGLPKDDKKVFHIYQRRVTSVCVGSQRINTKRSNTIPAWNPINGLPTEYKPGIIFYILKTDEGFWAGWFLSNTDGYFDSSTYLLGSPFSEMLSKQRGYIKLPNKIIFTSVLFPFFKLPTYYPPIIANSEDTNLGEDIADDFITKFGESSANVKEVLVKYRQRNSNLVDALKKLYKGYCQITGETFIKKNGENYSEVHHLIPLGEDGSDSFSNAIVVCPRIHRMLHYANVSPIDLSKIENGNLRIQINGEDYTITWKPSHEKRVKAALKIKDEE